jgi:hypothetical protein
MFQVIGDAATIGAVDYIQYTASTLELIISNDISTISATGDALLNDTKLDVEFSATPTVGDIFTVFDYDGSRTGTFSTFDNVVDSPLGADSVGLSINYGDGADDTVKLTVTSVVPEPSTFVLLAIGGVVGLLLWWRRRRG